MYLSVLMLHYRSQRSCGQGNVFTGVCLSTGGGVCLSACWDAIPPILPPPGSGRPPRTRQTPLDQADTPPGPGRHPRDEADPPGPGRHPRTRETPPLGPGRPPRTRQTPPGSRLQQTVYERPVRILLECILVNECIHCACFNIFISDRV